jgi:hypothetical protein
VCDSIVAIDIPSAGDNHSVSSSSSNASLHNEDDATVAGGNVSNPVATSTTATTAAPAPVNATPELKVENNPDGGVWITSQGVFYFKLNTLHIHLQFFYSVLKVDRNILSMCVSFIFLSSIRNWIASLTLMRSTIFYVH